MENIVIHNNVFELSIVNANPNINLSSCNNQSCKNKEVLENHIESNLSVSNNIIQMDESNEISINGVSDVIENRSKEEIIYSFNDNLAKIKNGLLYLSKRIDAIKIAKKQVNSPDSKEILEEMEIEFVNPVSDILHAFDYFINNLKCSINITSSSIIVTNAESIIGSLSETIEIDYITRICCEQILLCVKVL